MYNENTLKTNDNIQNAVEELWEEYNKESPNMEMDKRYEKKKLKKKIFILFLFWNDLLCNLSGIFYFVYFL
jgi:hypothetical protein